VTDKTFVMIIEAAMEDARRMDAPLSVRLKTVADKVRELSPDFADIVDRPVARLAGNGAGMSAPRPGDAKAPFLLPSSRSANGCPNSSNTVRISGATSSKRRPMVGA